LFSTTSLVSITNSTPLGDQTSLIALRRLQFATNDAYNAQQTRSQQTESAGFWNGVKFVSPLEIVVCPLKNPFPVLMVNWTVTPSMIAPVYQVPVTEPVKVVGDANKTQQLSAATSGGRTGSVEAYAIRPTEKFAEARSRDRFVAPHDRGGADGRLGLLTAKEGI
jgi:hypothetical protein